MDVGFDKFWEWLCFSWRRWCHKLLKLVNTLFVEQLRRCWRWCIKEEKTVRCSFNIHWLILINTITKILIVKRGFNKCETKLSTILNKIVEHFCCYKWIYSEGRPRIKLHCAICSTSNCYKILYKNIFERLFGPRDRQIFIYLGNNESDLVSFKRKKTNKKN